MVLWRRGDDPWRAQQMYNHDAGQAAPDEIVYSGACYLVSFIIKGAVRIDLYDAIASGTPTQGHVTFTGTAAPLVATQIWIPFETGIWLEAAGAIDANILYLPI